MSLLVVTILAILAFLGFLRLLVWWAQGPSTYLSYLAQTYRNLIAIHLVVAFLGVFGHSTLLAHDHTIDPLSWTSIAHGVLVLSCLASAGVSYKLLRLKERSKEM